MAAEVALVKAEQAIERHLLAFENGTLSEHSCGERVQALSSQLRDLRMRRDYLAARTDDETASGAHLR